jgi:N-acetyl-gamma-glutamyl-phosphate reductase
MPPEATSAEIVILGAAGYGGGELLRLLSGHPAAASLRPVSRSHGGQPVTAVHPHLHNLEGLSFAAWPEWDSLEGAAPLVIFSAMPHGELAGMFRGLKPQLDALAQRRRLVLIDLSADFRLDTPERYREHYGAEHPCPEFLGGFVFGLPELNREELCGGGRWPPNGGGSPPPQWIASPGCFATGLCLALLPLSGVDGLGLIALCGATGSSGSGVKPSETTHHPARAHDFRAYSPLRHRHLGEAELVMAAGGAQGYSLSFVPHSAPLTRGIFVTAQCLLPSGMDADDAAALIGQRYAGEPFVRVLGDAAQGRTPRVAAVAGSNYAEVGWAAHGRQFAVMCALDNLGKGMAGQAVQNMNLALGLPETAGLAQPGVYP